MSTNVLTTIGEIAKYAQEAISAWETGSDSIALPTGTITVRKTDSSPARFSLLQALLAVSEYEISGAVDIVSGETEISYVHNQPPTTTATQTA